MKHTIRQALHSNKTGSIQIPGDDFLENSPERSSLTQIVTDTSDSSQNTLVLTLEGEVIREYLIEDRNLSIGRSYNNDIQLNDDTLSGHHALISSIPDYVFIEDLGSTNGTLVNGRHIKKVALEHGDIIQIGHHQLTYLSEKHASYEPTMFIKAEYDETQFIYDDVNEETDILRGLPLAGLYSRGRDNQSSLPVMELRKTNSTVGFKGKSMALITREKNKYMIKAITGPYNRRSSDIPLLNGEAITHEQKRLKPGDIITVAGYDLGFYFLK